MRERPAAGQLHSALADRGALGEPWPDLSDAALRRTLAEAGFRAKLGITVIAILREPESVSGARPEDVIQQGDTLVTVGKAGQYPQFRKLLAGEPVEAA